LIPIRKKSADAPVDDFQAEFDKLVQLDQEWRDHFSQTNIPIRQSTEDEEKRQFMFDSLTAGTSLRAGADGAGARIGFDDEQRHVAELIIGNIDDYGYLKATVEELSAATNLPVEKKFPKSSKSSRLLIRRRRRARFARMPHAAA
jgi:RNA polymerase sigma-54 factor